MGYPRRLTPSAAAALATVAAVAEIRRRVQALAAEVDDSLASVARAALAEGAPATTTASRAGLTRRQFEALTARPRPEVRP